MSPSVAISYCPSILPSSTIPLSSSFVICSLSLLLCAPPLLPPYVLFTSSFCHFCCLPETFSVCHLSDSFLSLQFCSPYIVLWYPRFMSVKSSSPVSIFTISSYSILFSFSVFIFLYLPTFCLLLPIYELISLPISISWLISFSHFVISSLFCLLFLLFLFILCVCSPPNLPHRHPDI